LTDQYSSCDETEESSEKKSNAVSVDIDPGHVMECLMGHFVKNKSKWCEIENILQVINKVAKRKVVGISKYTFFKHFEKTINYYFHVYCSNLKCRKISKIKSGSDVKSFKCRNCEQDSMIENVEVAFVTFDLEAQLKELLENNKDELILPEKPWKEYPMIDVWSGKVHRKILKKNKKPFISLTLNTDGIQIFKSSGQSLWPIILSVNNLPLHKRFRQDNLIVCGFHMSNKVTMASFLESLIMEVETLNNQGGIDLSIGKYKIFCPLTCLDAPAKSKLQNMTQFNGFFGCTYCEDRGEFYNKSVKFSIRYVVF
jgi:hypothetical protein